MHGILFGMSLLGRCGLDATKIKMNAGIPHLARLVHPGARLLNPVPERPIGDALTDGGDHRPGMAVARLGPDLLLHDLV
jgi:hypothetical protein